MRLSKFQVVDNGVVSAVISKKGISKINSPKLLVLLKEAAQSRFFSDDKLANFCHQHRILDWEVLRFLEESIGFENDRIQNYFSSISFIPTCSEKNDNLDWGREACLKLKNTEQNFFTSNSSSIANVLRVYLGDDLVSKENRDFYFSGLENLQSGSMAGFVIDETFYLTPPFIPELGNPCLYCIITRAIQRLRKNSIEMPWLAIYDFLESHDLPPMQSNLTPHELDIIILFIKNQLNLILQESSCEFQETVYRVVSINLRNMMIGYQKFPHWYLCECRGRICN